MSHDTWLHRVARVGVRPLLGTAVSPNQLTTARLVSGLAAAALFGFGHPPYDYAAGALFLLSMLLDRADGELARIGGRSSAWGHSYDLLSDGLCNALVFVGIGVGLRGGTFGPAAVGMGLVAGLAVASVFWLVLDTGESVGQQAAGLERTTAVDPDDAMLVVPIAAFLGLTEVLLIAASLGAPAFALYVYVTCTRPALGDRGNGGARATRRGARARPAPPAPPE